MRIVIVLAFIIFSEANLFAQKKLVPVTQSTLTGIALPAGAKKDSRFLSVAAAEMLLEMQTSKSNTKLSATEVLVLPAKSSVVFNIDSLAKKLSDLGWHITVIAEDKKYAWLQKGTRYVISYFSMDASETALYLAEATSIPIQQSQGNKPLSNQPGTTGNIVTNQPAITDVNKSNENNLTNSAIIGAWGATASDQSSSRVQNGVMNYISRQYTFNANGTYRFISKAYDPLMDKILLGKEEGTYQVSGNNVSVSPGLSVLEAWSKKDGRDEWGKILSSQNVMLESVTYQFTKYYFSGVKVTSLVLQASKATQRDGPFSSNSTFANAWYYNPFSGYNTAIKLPNE
ncbi:MAG: hypothetical protein NTZ69_06405 [Bacteroidia bacterium]|nr:hypothetical protein [Bacteroidia bacterium]